MNITLHFLDKSGKVHSQIQLYKQEGMIANDVEILGSGDVVVSVRPVPAKAPAIPAPAETTAEESAVSHQDG